MPTQGPISLGHPCSPSGKDSYLLPLSLPKEAPETLMEGSEFPEFAGEFGLSEDVLLYGLCVCV